MVFELEWGEKLMKEKVCIVTPEIIGPHKNGGIGTHAYYLALELTKNNYDITVLFTGVCEYKDNLHWMDYYNDLNIKYVQIDEVVEKPKYTIFHDNWYINRSYFIYEYLKKNNFDFIHFQEWQANGFHTIQAKKNSNEFENTLITVTMHSPSQWLNQAMQEWNTWPLDQAKVEWCERYCCKNCDLLISPSNYMFSWAIDNGWKLADNRKVIPNCFKNKPKKKYTSKNTKHLIFFGRLETRKGLQKFCDSILKVTQEKSNSIEKISFVGKSGKIDNVMGHEYVHNKLGRIGIDYKIYSNFDSFKAIEYLEKENSVVVIPSLIENYPYTVVECIERDILFIASNVGGIPELADETVLFDSDVKALTNKILNLDKIFNKRIEHKYSKEKARKGWLSVHKEKSNYLKNNIKQKIEREKPLVSICISYYNYGRYLPQLLESISKSSYKNYEVVVVNDGSTEENSNKVFDYLKGVYNLPNWHFFNKENGGIGHTRNFAVKKSNGDYIIFMDADNIATPNMIYDYLYGIYKSGAECLTCHFNAFNGHKTVNKDTKIEYKYMPIGSALEVGFLQNVFGDANFIVKKEAFLELGGFLEDRRTTWEDWAFLIKLNLSGYEQDVIPKPLFWYRHHEKSFFRNSNEFKNYQNIVNAYYDNAPLYVGYLITALAKPLNNRFNEMINTIYEKQQEIDKLEAQIK